MNKNNSILIFCGIVLGSLLVFTPKDILMPMAFVLLALVLGIFLIYFQEPDKPKTLLKIFIFGFILRLVICSVLSAISYAKNGHVNFLYADDWGFNVHSIDLLRVWKITGEIPKGIFLWWMAYAGEITFPLWLSCLYYFLGFYTLMPLFINCSLGALSIILIYFIAKEIYNRKVAISAALFFTFWPSMVLWSTQSLKEPLITFLILLLLWSLLKLKKKIFNIIYWLVLLAALSVLNRLNRFIALIFMIMPYIYLAPFPIRKTVSYSLAFASFAYFSAVNSWFGVDKFVYAALAYNQSNFSFLAQLQSTRLVRAYSANSAFLIDRDISTLAGFITSLPELLFYVVFAPLPWQADNKTMFVSSIEMMVFLILIIWAIRGIIVTIRKVENGIMLLIFLFMVLIVLLGEGNIGTLFRHRSIIWPCWYIFISAGLFYKIRKT